MYHTLRSALGRKMHVAKDHTSLQALINTRRYEGDWTLYNTSAGVVRVSTPWRKMAENLGIHPDEFDHRGWKEIWHPMANTKIMERIRKIWNVDASHELIQSWRYGMFDERIVWQVIINDDYALRSLAATGFQPRVVLDIGGHIGTFALLASSLWPEATILSVEPDMRGGRGRDVSELFSLNTAGRPNVTIEKAALIGRLDDPEADRQQVRKELVEDSRNNGFELGFWGSEEHAEPYLNKPYLKAISVRALLEKHKIDTIDFLKLDCEGSETNILRELRDLQKLASIPYIRGEWHGTLAQGAIASLLSPSHRVQICLRTHGVFGLFRCSRYEKSEIPAHTRNQKVLR